jgi:hypothetical protein
MRGVGLQHTAIFFVNTFAFVQHHDAVGVGVGQRVSPEARATLHVLELQCFNGRLCAGVDGAQVTGRFRAPAYSGGRNELAHVGESPAVLREL